MSRSLSVAVPVSVLTYDEQLHREVKTYYADPFGFALAMFPWGKKGTTLEHYAGPDVWQADFLMKRCGRARIRLSGASWVCA